MIHNQQHENSQSVKQELTVTDQQSTLNEFFADGSAGYTENGEIWMSGKAAIKLFERPCSILNKSKSNRGDDDECFTGEDLLNLNVSEIPHLWEPYFPKTGLVGICGPSESGKSPLVKQLCLAIVNGDTTFLNSPLNSTHKNVIFISTEEGKAGMADYITLQNEVHPSSNFKGIRFSFDTVDPVGFLQKQLRKQKADLIVLDVMLKQAQVFRNITLFTMKIMCTQAKLRQFLHIMKTSNMSIWTKWK